MPKCENEESSRGLCQGCYTVASQLVKNGQTSWQDLEMAGKCKAAGTEKRTQRIQWLLSPQEQKIGDQNEANAA